MKRMNVVFAIPGMPFDGDTLKNKSLGGSETAGLCMSRAFAKAGHDVVVFNNTENPGKYDGVQYVPLSNLNTFMTFTAVDVFIAQRLPAFFNLTMKSKLNILWHHDIQLKRNREALRGALWNIDEIFGLSDFHVKQMMDVLQLPEEVFWQTRNAVDTVPESRVKRRQKRLIYTARPERGLETLLTQVMPAVWERDKDYELIVAGYQNTVPEMEAFYNALNEQIIAYQEQGFKISHVGALTKKQLYKQYHMASAYVYPTNFEETSCITMMECVACGLPVIASDKGALVETLDGAETVVHGDPMSSEFIHDFVDAIFNAKHCQKNILPTHTWDDVAKSWIEHFYEMFVERQSNKETLAKNLYRTEDIMALKHLNMPDWNERIENEYRLNTGVDLEQVIAQGEKYTNEVHGENRDQNLEPRIYNRFDVALQELDKNPPKTLLDYAGACGHFAIIAANRFECSADSVDISAAQQEVGINAMKEYSKNPELVTFHPDIPDKEYDAVFAGEILEHVTEPIELIDKLESHCIDGGQIIFTVPFGPWGDIEDAKEGDFRGHLWNFTKLDLKELFGRKKNLSIKLISGSVNDFNNETLGWHVVSYTVSKKIKTGVVNLDRKLFCQAPRQTLSVCLIVGGKQEGHLHQCLSSVYNIADEIIVSDTDMSLESYKICKSSKYKNKLKIFNDNFDPLVDGFDAARNANIAHAGCDWILWIDADEELLTPVNIYKYLRHNIFNGYSIKQHHFSAQPSNAFKADIPVRLFRNHKGIKFFGKIHEHPEQKLNQGVGDSSIISDVDISHTGYLTEANRRKKFNRNFPLMQQDREKYPERILGKFLEMRDRVLLSRYSIERSQNQLTEDAVRNCEHVVRTYQKDFLGDISGIPAMDAIEFYSEALEILGKGLVYNFALDVHNGKPAPIKDHSFRFASNEDFMIFIRSMTTGLSEKYSGKYA